jgi:hypothetical protein
LLARPGHAALLAVLVCTPGAVRADTDFQVTPAAVTLEGNYARAQIVVTAGAGTIHEKSVDLTHRAVFASSNPAVVTAGPTGQLLAIGNGTATVTVKAGTAMKAVPVRVSGVVVAPPISFTEQVMPVLSRAGCNAGACHASQHGKGGFKLSVFAYDPAQDHFNIVRGAMSRRVSFVEPAQSLFLLKPTTAVPHGGGRRIAPGSADYQLLRSWITAGAPGPGGNEAHVKSLEVFPARRVGLVGFTQQLRVVARYDNGKERDVTAWARFDSMDDGVLKVSRDGLIETVGRGQGTALVRFEGLARIAQVVVPYAGSADLSGWVDHNFIDKLAAAKFRELGISPSPSCDDATFLRRAYLDAVGTLPTVKEAAEFLDSHEPDKRAKLIDRLLGLTGDPAKDIYNNDYAAYWGLKWSDLLRCSSVTLGEQGMWAMSNWLKGSFRGNKRMDRFVRELIAARGSTYDNGPANYYMAFGGGDSLAEATAQIFLGMRVQCARCHHHPFEKISRANFYELVGFFHQVGSKASANYGKLGGPNVILIRPDNLGPKLPAEILGVKVNSRTVKLGPDRRRALADWMTDPENPLLARNIVNRYVAYLLGRGLVEPIDDLRATNPPSNVELMDALAADFIKHGYDVKHLLRTIMMSRLYQLDSQPTRDNATDRRFYSHYLVKRIPAEALLDAIDAVTGVPTKFDKVPLGTRAIELPDGKYENYFLQTFGKPKREAVCECERVSDPNLAQALHTLNSDAIDAKIGSGNGRIARLLVAKTPHADIVTELYLATLSRRPTAAEQAACKKLLAEAGNAQAFYEDLMWSLINSKHFLFVH